MADKDPHQEFRENLPIFKYKQQLIDMVCKNDMVVITGDTGSGKSTQLPQYLYDSTELRGVLKKTGKLRMVITQPRRVATIAMAKRICWERGINPNSQEVSYAIRFDDRTNDSTYLRYETDGILVRECLGDRLLRNYDVVILDEAHERSIYTDVLFALVKEAVRQRAGGLKLVVTSATLNTELFAKYFGNCPILEMEGRCFDVDVKYLEVPGEKRVEEAVTNAVRLHLHEGIGEILVFLTGSEECEQAVQRTSQVLEQLINDGREVPAAAVYALYGAQSSEDQSRIFEPLDEDIRKIIFSTNIAETSLTIDNVGYVIDCGWVKQKVYHPKTGMDCLVVVPISKVQAVQRKGRAGRTRPGKCLRMYSEKFFNSQMPDQSTPEILRVNLTSLTLTLKCIGVDDVLGFDYLERPEDELLEEALKHLHLLNALDDDGKASPFGRELCKLPMEPHFSKALLVARALGAESDVLAVVALLSSERLFVPPPRMHQQRMEDYESAFQKLSKPQGDHATMASVYREWINRGKSEQWARKNFLNARALRQAEQISIQISQLLSSLNSGTVHDQLKHDQIYSLASQAKSLPYVDKLCMSLASAFFFNAARKLNPAGDEYMLLGSGTIVSLDPSSAFVAQNHFPDYIIFSELAGSGSVRGTMRTCSYSKEEWVTKYVQQLKKFRLERDSKVPSKALVAVEVQKVNLQKLEESRSTDRNDRIEAAKLKFQQREAMRMQMTGGSSSKSVLGSTATPSMLGKQVPINQGSSGFTLPAQKQLKRL